MGSRPRPGTNLPVSLHSQAVFESVSDPPGARWQGFFGVRSNGAAGWCTTGLNRREQKRLSHGAFVTLIAAHAGPEEALGARPPGQPRRLTGP